MVKSFSDRSDLNTLSNLVEKYESMLYDQRKANQTEYLLDGNKKLREVDKEAVLVSEVLIREEETAVVVAEIRNDYRETLLKKLNELKMFIKQGIKPDDNMRKVIGVTEQCLSLMSGGPLPKNVSVESLRSSCGKCAKALVQMVDQFRKRQQQQQQMQQMQRQQEQHRPEKDYRQGAEEQRTQRAQERGKGEKRESVAKEVEPWAVVVEDMQLHSKRVKRVDSVSVQHNMASCVSVRHPTLSSVLLRCGETQCRALTLPSPSCALVLHLHAVASRCDPPSLVMGLEDPSALPYYLDLYARLARNMALLLSHAQAAGLTVDQVEPLPLRSSLPVPPPHPLWGHDLSPLNREPCIKATLKNDKGDEVSITVPYKYNADIVTKAFND